MAVFLYKANRYADFLVAVEPVNVIVLWERSELVILVSKLSIFITKGVW